MAYKIYDKKGEFKNLINKVLEQFGSGQILEKLELSYLRQSNIPSDKWSTLNKILMMIEGTTDARTFNAWKEAGSPVKLNQGVKAFYIVAPMMIQVKEWNEDTKSFEYREQLIGFRPQPEFRLEDTENPQKIIDEYVEKMAELPKYQDIAKGLGIKVSVARTMMGEYGSYNSVQKEIKLASKDSHVFFHELAHGAHDIYLANHGKKMNEQTKEYKETVAEFSGIIIAKLFGYETTKADIGFCQDYLKHHLKTQDTETVFNKITELLKDIEGVMEVVLKGKTQNKKNNSKKKLEEPIKVISK